MLRVRANHPDHALTVDDLTFVAHLFYRSPYFHRSLINSQLAYNATKNSCLFRQTTDDTTLNRRLPSQPREAQFEESESGTVPPRLKCPERAQLVAGRPSAGVVFGPKQMDRIRKNSRGYTGYREPSQPIERSLLGRTHLSKVNKG
jgi:hypothetical protein